MVYLYLQSRTFTT